MWRAGIGRGFGPVVRQTTKMNEYERSQQVFQTGIVEILTRLYVRGIYFLWTLSSFGNRISGVYVSPIEY
jgi:hypothetical protein